MDEAKIAKASTTVDVSADKVWHALVTPEVIQRYMFGTNVVAEWKQGGAISWKGEWKGKPYEDKGVILRHDPKRMLRYTHWSPLSGKPDTPENQHTVTIALAEQDGHTQVSLTQDNNRTEEERAHSEKNWTAMLEGLKKVVEA
jgi:uncharacterized protein YndB with AHSA1/START domain